MITTNRADEFLGYVAIDHHTSPSLFERFLMKESIDPLTFVGIDTYFPDLNYTNILDLKIVFKSNEVLNCKTVKIELQEFLKLFVAFRIVFAPKNDLNQFIDNTDSIFDDCE